MSMGFFLAVWFSILPAAYAVRTLGLAEFRRERVAASFCVEEGVRRRVRPAKKGRIEERG
jgi:hypothetical protein